MAKWLPVASLAEVKLAKGGYMKAIGAQIVSMLALNWHHSLVVHAETGADVMQESCAGASST